MPAAPLWGNQAATAPVLGSTNRIIAASVIPYPVSQSFDAWVFSRLKDRFGGRYLWLRNHASTALSQLIDTVMFTTRAFACTRELLPLIVGQLVVKWIIALLDTPVVYALVYLVRRRMGPPSGSAGAPV